jgi:hypothetical protein
VKTLAGAPEGVPSALDAAPQVAFRRLSAAASDYLTAALCASSRASASGPPQECADTAGYGALRSGPPCLRRELRAVRRAEGLAPARSRRHLRRPLHRGAADAAAVFGLLAALLLDLIGTSALEDRRDARR